MIKCFLSHSSQDKEGYVRVVANRLRREQRVLDEEAFEEGMRTIDEIALGLDASSLFVIFLSDASLKSSWVRDELSSAKQRFDENQIKRIFPIIIDADVSHLDPRIPAWMREDLNIQPILKPEVAARRINARLLELSWEIHPRLRERRDIFVGRNDLISQIEERFDDFQRSTPVALIASGLPAIGRKTVLQKALKKANIVKPSYEFSVISLSALDSIEDFIVKIHDLGIIDTDVPDISDADVARKIEIAIAAILAVAKERERILIEDRGVIVQRDGEIVDWFLNLANELASSEHLLFCIASQNRPNAAINRSSDLIFSVSVKELEVSERNGLLNRYSRFLGLDLVREDLEFFADILSGFPEQVLFAADIIKESGLYEAKKQSHLIQRYASDKAQLIVERYSEDVDTLNIIYLLSKFEFISYEVLFDIVDESKYGHVVSSLISAGVCERLGVNSEYLRINEVIRDYVSRNRFSLPGEFDGAIARHVANFVKSYQDESTDVSDYIFSVQESLRSGGELPDHMVLPSVFVKTIKKLYDEERKYPDVVVLSDRVLLRERFLHKSTVTHVRFLQCQALARLGVSRFFDEVRKVDEPYRSFLYGFKYRLSGNYEKAEENLLRALSKKRSGRDPRVIGELVQVYMQSDEHDKALELASENYRQRPSNAINANNYFACLISRPRSTDNEAILQAIIQRLSLDSSEKSQEMVDSMRAKFAAIYQNDSVAAFNFVEDAIARNSDVVYPLLTKADVALQFRDAVKLAEAIAALEGVTSQKAQSYRALVKFKAYLLAMRGSVEQAKSLVAKELNGMLPGAYKRLVERLESLSV